MTVHQKSPPKAISVEFSSPASSSSTTCEDSQSPWTSGDGKLFEEESHPLVCGGRASLYGFEAPFAPKSPSSVSSEDPPEEAVEVLPALCRESTYDEFEALVPYPSCQACSPNEAQQTATAAVVLPLAKRSDSAAPSPSVEWFLPESASGLSPAWCSTPEAYLTRTYKPFGEVGAVLGLEEKYREFFEGILSLEYDIYDIFEFDFSDDDDDFESGSESGCEEEEDEEEEEEDRIAMMRVPRGKVKTVGEKWMVQQRRLAEESDPFCLQQHPFRL
eukprot:TRINITY_DN2429_c0_g5_i1.p1 TRINITY_DN2429_c0_g5~~TRINITY_DN2429_c0_g5_i1.p1  ORF type:complete len:274 (-),score=47.68 TRINITY_DN2429_c0_g5_i1:538-1359(-)